MKSLKSKVYFKWCTDLFSLFGFIFEILNTHLPMFTHSEIHIVDHNITVNWPLINMLYTRTRKECAFGRVKRVFEGMRPANNTSVIDSVVRVQAYIIMYNIILY